MDRNATDSQKIAYEILGEDGPWVVLSTGIANDMRVWSKVVPLLAGCRVLRHDWPGHGGSASHPPAPGAWDLADYAASLLYLMDQLEIPSGTLVGVSLGAMVSAEAAIAAPLRVDGLVWCNAVAQATPQYSALWTDVANRALKGEMEGLISQMTSRWLVQPAAPQLQDLARDMILQTHPAGLAAAANALSRLSLRDRLSSLQCQVRFVAGEKDAAAQVEVMREVADLVPASRFDCLENVAHLSPLEAPGEIARIILETAADARQGQRA